MIVLTLPACARHVLIAVALILTAFLAGLVLHPTNVKAQQVLACGGVAKADVVVLIDLSGGMSHAQIQAQKAGATHLLNLFDDLVVKPRVAVGTFNSVCASYGECYNPLLDEARIVVPLSSNYTSHLAALAPGGTIQGQGPGGSGLGGTNMEEAIQEAQEHLASNGDPNLPNYLILISDGDPNLPGYYISFECGNCWCPQAEAAGAAAADAARSAGTDIFSIHVGATSCGGNEYLRDYIADNVSKHFFSGGAFEGPFFEIAQAIQCDDNRSCTADTCNESSGQCEFTELDLDGNQIGDCGDICEGPNSPVGDPCDGPDFDNCNGGIFECVQQEVLTCTDDPEVDDADQDGTWDCLDGCPNDPNKTAPGACGCGVADTDSDGDGTPNCNDGCPNDPHKIAPGVCGCGVPDTDSDGDGTPNCIDGCPNDPNKVTPGVCGCGVPDTDSDGDGTPNCNDGCPNDPNKIAPGVCGCGVPDTDSDGDGTPNCNDGCPSDPNKIAPGVCGCGVPDTDSDGDGTPNCNDLCPNDPNKIVPGACGCGVLDTDSDGDGTPDCNDGCPSDPGKVTPGVCGCGVAETDSDGDGVPNCNDGCPNDPNKTVPGVCGCGIPDLDLNNDGVFDCVDQCPNDPNKTVPGVCGCGVPDVDLNGNGVIDCQESPGGQCSSTDVRGYISALDTIVGEQDVQLKRLLRGLQLGRNVCPDPAKVKRFIKMSKRDSAKLKGSIETRISVLPEEVLSCPDGIGCSSSAITLDVNAYGSESNELGVLSRKALKMHRNCLAAGRCDDDSASCRRRALLRAKQIREERRRIRELYDSTLLNLSNVPKLTYTCA